MSYDRSNHPRLDEIASLPIAEIAALPPEHLALLQEEAAARLEATKRLADWVNAAILLKYEERAITALIEAGKTTGTARFEDGGITAIVDLPKKVEWDQKRLGAVVELIRTSGDDPTEYVTSEFKVAERSYNAWPSAIRDSFAPARTVRTGKLSIRLSINKEDM
ncbi:MAG: hypothetical protein U1E67_11770 [Hyphomicrobiales bacterium]